MKMISNIEKKGLRLSKHSLLKNLYSAKKLFSTILNTIVLVNIVFTSAYANSLPAKVVNTSPDKVKSDNLWLVDTLINPDESWLMATPNKYDYNTIEQFFLKSGCSFGFTTAYLYDTNKQHWLTYNEAVTDFPQMKPVLNSQECNINISKNELAQLLSIDWSGKNGLVMLYFDVPHQADGTWAVAFTEKLKTDWLAIRTQAASFQEVPRYLVQTPIKGHKPQKF